MAPSLPGASTVIDSLLFRDAFGTPAMREIFSDRALVARYVEVEVALARAEARCGVIPADAADVIGRESRLDRIDFDHLRDETDVVGYPILPLVHQLVAMCGEAGRYVHWGATTQDIMDTANVLQIRAALAIVEADIRELRGILASLATKHRDTPMAGRTHLQQALPVTSATRSRSGWRCSTATSSAWRSCASACWSSASRARPARWPRSAAAASTSSKRWPTNWNSPYRPPPGTSPAMRSPRRSTCSR
jgi:hypothetical protein